MRPIRVDVLGTPAPQGSKRAYVRGTRAVLVESSANVKPWREAVKHAARQVMNDEQHQQLTGAVSLHVMFRLLRPAGHYGTGRNAQQLRPSAPLYPAVKPDGDKLLRSTCDALTDAAVYRDDAQVVDYIVIKRYVELGQPAGASIVLQPAGVA